MLFAISLLFEDNFAGDLSEWHIWRALTPFIDSNDVNPNPCFNPILMATMEAGVQLLKSFTLSPGLVI